MCSCDEPSSVVPCNGMECYELKMPLVVRSRCVVPSDSVTMRRSKVLPRTTKYYKVLLQFYNVLLQRYKELLQYYSVLQSTPPVLLCTALLQYYFSTTPVLLCTTKYYSSTKSTLHYKVLLQYYSVLQSTTPAHSRTTKY